MVTKKNGYSLVELIIVVIFLGVFAAIAVPRLNRAVLSKHRADTLARKIVTDLRRTRRLAISDAATNTEGFQLKMIGAAPSPVPIPLPFMLAAAMPLSYTSYEIINLNTGATVDSHKIDPHVRCRGGNEFNFSPLGNLKPGSDTRLTVSAEGKTFTLTVIPATGTVKCVEN